MRQVVFSRGGGAGKGNRAEWEGKYDNRKDTVVRWGQGGEAEEGEQTARIKYV